MNNIEIISRIILIGGNLFSVQLNLMIITRSIVYYYKIVHTRYRLFL